MGNVRETWWAERDRNNYATVADAFPAALETAHDDWQWRVDQANTAGQRSDLGDQTYLRVIRATRMEKVDDVWTQTDDARTYLVAAKSVGAAWDRVQRYLEAHGQKSSEWSLFFPEGGQVLVLS